VDSERLASVFVELADTMVDNFDVLELLHLLVDRSVELLSAEAAGLMINGNGGVLELVTASSEQAELIELVQLQADEGPCLDCYRTGEAVRELHLDQAQDRWPRFVPAAIAAGFTSVIALPMRLRGQVIGGLNLFGTQETPPVHDEHLPIAQALADAATIAILQERLVRRHDTVNEQLQHALNSRVVIEQAKGVLSARMDITTAEAFELLRAHARSHRRRLSEVAEDVAAGRVSALESKPRTTR
jgi:GAF domain-containing protein